jgi:hypothetical protein
MLPKAFAQAPKGEIRRRITRELREKAALTRDIYKDDKLLLTDQKGNFVEGNRIFWNTTKVHTWATIDARLRQLHEAHKHEAIAHFTKLAYQHVKTADVLINLSRSALTKDVMRRCLAVETLDEGSDVRQRMMSSSMTSCGFIAAATILLSEEQSAAFAEKALQFTTAFSIHSQLVVDSCGMNFQNAPEDDIRGQLTRSGFRQPKEHRLVIVRSVSEVPNLSLLFSDAKKVTVFALDDLYGRADFTSNMHHAGQCDVSIEHSRSRITRFSAGYHRVHEDTRAISETLISQLKQACGNDFEVTDPKGATLALADYLFFPSLQFAALERLVQAKEFDHIVIALGGTTDVSSNQNSEFINLLSGIDSLAKDARLELLCMSLNKKVLITLDDNFARLAAGAVTPTSGHTRRRPLKPALAELTTQSMIASKKIRSWPEKDHPRVLLAVSQVAAYNRSSAAYAASLAETNNLKIAFLGGNLLSFTKSTDEIITPGMIVPLPQKPHGDFDSLLQWLVSFIRDNLNSMPQNYITHVISCRINDTARSGLLTYLVHCHLCDAWFSRMQSAGTLPKIVVLTPFRNVRVAAFAAIARRYDVPSIALEPHGLNAAYCRYIQVTADYYGVVSTFFAQAAVDGFGMSLVRSPVVGSPRLKAPDDYDMVAATDAIRKQLTADHDIIFDPDTLVFTYFTQPTDWDQISHVWEIILAATAAVKCKIILKTHPEETPSRVAAYLRVAEAMDASDRVFQVNSDAVSLIEASDLVLSGYSATVVEAALYRRPVFCVTNGEVDYPLNQHDVVGGPLFRTTESLRAEILAFIKDAGPYHAAAEAFLEQEPQLVEGFEKHLRSLVADVIAQPIETSLRAIDEVPETLFIDAPHTVYQV